jgi:hypothetical protein
VEKPSRSLAEKPTKAHDTLPVGLSNGADRRKSIVDRAFAYFTQWKPGDPVRMHKTLTVLLKTSLGWHRHWIRDPAWRPSRPNLSLRGRFFTADQEAELARRARDDYLSNGYILTKADFRILRLIRTPNGIQSIAKRRLHVQAIYGVKWIRELIQKTKSFQFETFTFQATIRAEPRPGNAILQ